VRASEDAWNSGDPERVSAAYSLDSQWRNRSEFVQGRERIKLGCKWEREQHHRLIKELWTFSDNRIAVRFQYECHNSARQWFRSYGNELWEFDEAGLMRRSEVSINDVPIAEVERKFRWDPPRNTPWAGWSEVDAPPSAEAA